MTDYNLSDMERRYAASGVIFNAEGHVLVAKRGPNKRPFPNTWSLPSTYLGEGEYTKTKLPQAVNRKLGITIELLGQIGRKTAPQADYLLTMTDHLARICYGELQPDGENFTEAKYIDFLKEFKDKDRKKMGLCTQILLEELEKDSRFWERFLIKR